MLIGKQVQLREYRSTDAEKAQNYLNDFEVTRLLTPGIPFPYTLEDEKQWVSSQSAMKDLYNFAIETLEDGRYIGGCGINHLDWKNSIATVGIFIGDKSLWGKGYGTDAMKLLISFIFEQMNINKIKLNVYAFNERAVKCYEKCGFVKEGTLRQEIYRDGRYYDVYVMGLLKTDERRS